MGNHNHYNDDKFSRGQSSIDWQVKQAVEELRKKGENVLKAAKNALKDGANLIVNDMRKRAPVYKGRANNRVVPGLLKSSIKAESKADGAIYEFSANAKNPYDNFLYGPIVEFAKWRKIHGRKVKARRQAFMYPALDAHRNDVNKMVKDAINAAIARGN